MYKNVLTIWFKEKIDSFVVGIFNTEEYRLQHKEDFIQVYVKKEARDLLDLAVKNS